VEEPMGFIGKYSKKLLDKKKEDEEFEKER
jgi:hypothetical protein